MRTTLAAEPGFLVLCLLNPTTSTPELSSRRLAGVRAGCASCTGRGCLAQGHCTHRLLLVTAGSVLAMYCVTGQAQPGLTYQKSGTQGPALTHSRTLTCAEQDSKRLGAACQCLQAQACTHAAQPRAQAPSQCPEPQTPCGRSLRSGATAIGRQAGLHSAAAPRETLTPQQAARSASALQSAHYSPNDPRLVLWRALQMTRAQ